MASLARFVFCSIGIAISLSSAFQTFGEEQFRALFDGKTLNGFAGDLTYWSVRDGAIVGQIPPGQTLNKNTWLIWKGGELSDFDLRLQFRLTGHPSANSGIQVRCQVDHVDHVSGYQADLDQGQTWLGRIYDEHGRALLVERGQRVQIDTSGKRRQESFAPANQFALLFRENAWNDYRIVGVGNHLAVYVNGTLFSEIVDEEAGQADLRGQLAFQLHSGPETKIEFRDIQLVALKSDDTRLKPLHFKKPLGSEPADAPANDEQGSLPRAADGRPLNLGFETGDLVDWVVVGDAFQKQPVNQDGISSRWPGQVSNKAGDYFIGGYEVVQDRGQGALTSAAFDVTKPYASFLFAGGDSPATRCELVKLAADGNKEKEEVFFTTAGRNREQMQRVAVDLRGLMGQRIKIRLVDDSPGAWGHLNFDDFRLHDQPPVEVNSPLGQATAEWRSTFNPVLQHLVPNTTNVSTPVAPANAPASTLASMYVPEGFSVDLVAAEPDLHQPMAFTFDGKGRLWVVEGYSYPQKRPDGEGLDRILIFEDQDHDGSFETRKVFAEHLNLVSGMAVGHGGVWVGAAPELLFLPDRNQDDLPDGPAEVLLNGFGFADTHETLNSLMWGPDGWLYGNQGVFNASRVGKPDSTDTQRVTLGAGVWRYHPTRHQFEVFAHGGSNQWGLDFDELGQIFMTHCRSYWGKGSTTHVMQGGHYWNQINAGYAPFINTANLPGRDRINYLLASARYDHGEGGAGKPGSNEVYGGHSHVGTMIYLGDNWPSEYRNRLFTHNLHGHQINQQINRREAGGFNTIHAGSDVFFCADKQYIGVDLQCGPDGAVYISDWYDPRHCHSPNAEQWDRGNGRLYRMKYDATYQPVSVDYRSASVERLVEAQRHANDWHARMARLELVERAGHSALDIAVIQSLIRLATGHEPVNVRLRALWCLHGIGGLDTNLLLKLSRDPDEAVRGWVIQLSTDRADKLQGELVAIEPAILERMIELADSDTLWVLRYLASALQRIEPNQAWQLAERLVRRADMAVDRDLPKLLWHGLAELVLKDPQRGIDLAKRSQVAELSDFILWYLASQDAAARNQLVSEIKSTEGAVQLVRLELLELALRGRQAIEMPTDWPALAPKLYQSSQPQVVALAESIGAAMGDEAAFERVRARIRSGQLNEAQLRQALRTLANNRSAENVDLLLVLLDHPQLAAQAITMLTPYQDPRIAAVLLGRLASQPADQVSASMELLCSRAEWANQLLDAIAAGQVPKSSLTAFYARQMSSLGDQELNARLEKEWGKLGQSSSEVKAEIRQLVAAYQSAPLWAYSESAGAAHFKRLCAQCHEPDQNGATLAPNLAGSGSKGIEYLVENVLDPNAVIGRDFQATVFVTSEGRVITGLLIRETDDAFTIKTLNDEVVVSKDDVDEQQLSPNSFMPEGLLKTLKPSEQIELMKYLMAR